MNKIAVIRIAGRVRLSKEIESTLELLNLKKKFSCVIVENTKTNLGMIKKVKDYVTYGEVNEETIKLLNEKRSKGKKFFSLHPPIKGFERKGTKKSFKEGGALGYRGEKINELIKRML
ncbi:MAG: uL30 family ribosomal protein [Candidatus Woesearchaeota archaeon]